MGVGQDRGGVAVLDPVVVRLGPARVAREPARLAELGEGVAPAGDQLVYVRLVAGVPQHDVAGRVEDPVQRQRQLDHAEVGAEVPAMVVDRIDDERSDLRRQLGQLGKRQPAQVGRTGHGVEDHARRSPLGRGSGRLMER
jgi:hypothetical protein